MKEEYLFLEALRQTGIVNMFQAARYIPMFFPKYDESNSVKCLAEWMDKPKDYTSYEEKNRKIQNSNQQMPIESNKATQGIIIIF